MERPRLGRVCPDFDTAEELEAQNLGDQRYGWDEAAVTALETKHASDVTKYSPGLRPNGVFDLVHVLFSLFFPPLPPVDPRLPFAPGSVRLGPSCFPSRVPFHFGLPFGHTKSAEIFSMASLGRRTCLSPRFQDPLETFQKPFRAKMKP